MNTPYYYIMKIPYGSDDLGQTIWEGNDRAEANKVYDVEKRNLEHHGYWIVLAVRSNERFVWDDERRAQDGGTDSR